MGATTFSSGFARVTANTLGPGPSDSALLEAVAPILAVEV
jgi:hypothetical protein